MKGGKGGSKGNNRLRERGIERVNDDDYRRRNFRSKNMVVRCNETTVCIFVLIRFEIKLVIMEGQKNRLRLGLKNIALEFCLNHI